MSVSLALLLLCGAKAQVTGQKNAYQFFIDLNRVDNDELKIELITPKINQPAAVYHLPAIVPGTYAIYDFGRYVSQFKAYTKKGDTLEVQRINVDSWSISHAASLYKITYLIDDTWDSPKIKGEKIFEPAGSNIEAGKDFMLNTFAFAGYFDGFDKISYELNFTKPADFYGATALIPVQTTPTTEKYAVSNYHDLADAPIMFSRPDTAVLKIGGADVLIALYSPNKKASVDTIASHMKVMLEAQKEYLGGRLPVKKYAFLIALTDNRSIFNYGALEHSYSSFYFLPEWFSNEKLAETIMDAASHEFFHILTPLSIHSHEIGDFDFANPVMSKHLWLYEGMTEYEAQHMQVKYHLIDLPEFLKRLTQKITTSKYFNDSLPFTVMSKGVLKTYANQFINVYMKGAMICFCLDIRLRQLSGGKYGTQDLMRDLSMKYGKDRAFNDEELFDTITALTYPSIRDFFRDYVEGSKPLPYAETFDAIGIAYSPVSNESVFRLGIQFSNSDSSNRPVVVSASHASPFGAKLDLHEKDKILSINGTPVTGDSLISFMDRLKKTIREGDDFTMVVLRKDSAGQEKTISIYQKAEFSHSEEKNALRLMADPTPAQLALRAAWLNTDNSHN
jgi:predicted metalloprotease with PDZ domain